MRETFRRAFLNLVLYRNSPLNGADIRWWGNWTNFTVEYDDCIKYFMN